MSISITGGRASGIKLEALKGGSIRPTKVRAKRGLFDSVAAGTGWEGRTIVDLFAGSGALGLEAASRGAVRVFLVENNFAHCRTAEKNIVKVKRAFSGGDCPEITLIRKDAGEVYNHLYAIAGNIDIILSDPPYAQSADYLADILNNAEFANWAADSLLIWETPDKINFSFDKNDLWNLEKRRKFAGTEFMFWKRKKY